MPREREPKTQCVAKRSQEDVTRRDDQLFDNILAEGDSFETLKTATSGGAHFQFKNEKSWTESDAPMNSRFQVHISSMNENFSSIPFDERRNLYFKCCAKRADVDQLSREGLADSSKFTFEDDAEEISTLSRKLDELDATWTAFVQAPVAAESVEETLSTSTVMLPRESKNEDVTVSKLSKLNVTEEKCDRATKPTESNKHSMEDWLDSILDD